MLFKYSTILVFGIFAALKVHASVLPRAHECFTIDSAKVAALVGPTIATVKDQVLELDSSSSKNLILSGGMVAKAEFQSCPKLSPSTSFERTGRLKITGTDDCLTVKPVTGSPQTWTVFVAECAINDKPSPEQTWVYGNNMGNNIFYVGSTTSTSFTCTSGAGVWLQPGNQPKTVGTSEIQLICNPATGTMEPLTLKH